MAKSDYVISSWKLPPIVAAICVSIVGGFYLGGPGLGLAVGGMAAGALIVMAIRKPPRYPISPPLPRDFRRHLLVVLGGPLEDGDAVDALAGRLGDERGGSRPEVLLVAPARHGFLQRWAADLDPGRYRAQESLVLSSASLARAGIEARGRVGDEDPVQLIEDELRSFPATEVVLVDAPRERDALGAKARDELRERLEVPLWDLVSPGRGGASSAGLKISSPLPIGRALDGGGR
jgi:hypothetical protein